MKAVPYIKKKGQTYYYERRVPKGLIEIIGQAWVRKSLKTKDLPTAIHRSELENKRLALLQDSTNPRALYASWVERISNAPSMAVDIDGRLETPSHAEDIHDLLSSTAPDQRESVLASLSPSDRARFYAAQKVEQGIAAPAEYAYTLLDAYKELIEVKRDSVAPKTLTVYKRALDVFIGSNPPGPIETLTRPMVVLWVQEMLAANHPKTVGNWLTFLGQMYQHAIDTGHLSDSRSNIFRGHRMPRRRTQNYEEMTASDLKAILKELKDPYQLPGLIGWYTGMRVSEVASCTITTVDGLRCFYVATGKTKAATRWVPVHPALAALLDGCEAVPGATGDYSKRFGRAKVKALPDADRSLGFHSLRVAFISHALRAGYSEADVARLVGHEGAKGRLETAQTYYRGPSLAHLAEIVRAIPEV